MSGGEPARQMMPEVVVVGSVNRDLTVEVPRLPAPGETVLGFRHRWDNGGKGANQAVAAARLGRSVALVARVGSHHDLSSFESEGIDVSHVVRDPDAGTGLAVITVEDGGENSIVVSPGANARLSVDDVEAAAGLLAGATVVLLQLEVPRDAVYRAAELAGGTVILNPAPAAELPAGLTDHVDVLVPNRSELAFYAGADGDVADRAAALGTRVVVTLGAGGALVVAGGAATHVAAPAIDAVDATAAGDAFCGALADATTRGLDLVAATRWAVAAGAAAATRAGAQASLPSAADVAALA